MPDIKEMIAAARDAGWRVNKSRRNSHWKLTPPDADYPPVVLPSSPGDRRSLKNARAQLRRAGLRI